MHDDVLRAVIGLEYQAVLLAAAPLTGLAVGWVTRQLAAHLHDRRAAMYAARLVAWAEQVIPAKSARYAEVAALLSRRFPALSGEQLEVLIESEVLDLKSALRTVAEPTAAGAAPSVAVGGSSGGPLTAALGAPAAAPATGAPAAPAEPIAPAPGAGVAALRVGV